MTIYHNNNNGTQRKDFSTIMQPPRICSVVPQRAQAFKVADSKTAAHAYCGGVDLSMVVYMLLFLVLTDIKTV